MASQRNSTRNHRILGAFAGLCTLVAMIGTFARALPEELQALPYVPIVVSATPWFTIVAVAALILALVSARYVTALFAVACIGAQIWWQAPFFLNTAPLPDAASAAVAAVRPDTTDAYARVMTCNVYKGQADPQAIVDLVRDNRIEVLALQETTDGFVRALNDAGLATYLPYAKVSSSDGVFGNGLWSATPLGDPKNTDVDSSASFMPGGTVGFANGRVPVRFISVHTTAPVPGYWHLWRKSLDELAAMSAQTTAATVFMGDFNATVDHTPFRAILGERFHDAAQSAGHGFAFTWPANRPGIPRFAGIDHIVLDRGMTAGQVSVEHVAGSDHAALIATIAVK